MLCMVSYPRRTKSGQITCYLIRTYHVLTTASSGGFDAVAVVGVEGGGFDLDPEESVVEFDYGVVAVAVSPGDADAEAEGGGAGEEGGFGGFSATLAGRLGDVT